MDGSTGYVGRDRVERYTGSGPGVGPENQVMISGQYLAWSSDAFVKQMTKPSYHLAQIGRAALGDMRLHIT